MPMPQNARIWRVQDDKTLAEVEPASLDTEARLEDWLEKDISILSENLLVVGRQVDTDVGGILDLLCIDPAGDLVVVELKRHKTPRQVVAQALDYASWVVDLSSSDVEDQAQSYLDGSLDEAFRDAFDKALPDVINESHKILIVGAQIDDRSERIIEYLSDVHGVNINAATFQYFEDENAGDLLSRVFLIEPTKVETRTRRKGTSKRKPNLTRSELEALADEQGIGEWYRTIVQEVEPLFQRAGTTRSSLAVMANLSDTRFEKGRGTVFSLWPDPDRWPDSRQECHGVLYFQVYTYRLAARCDVEEETIRSILPEDHDDWSYGGDEEEWSGADGFFLSDEDVESFVEGITDLADT